MDVHGQEWQTLHNGYFADRAVAAAFVDRVREVITASCPEVIVDLGGGTGFLLGELKGQGLYADLRLVNLDCSDRQLALASGAGVCCVQGSIATVRRAALDKVAKRFLFMMRSVLHYFGRDGLEPVLRHLRQQARSGEFLVHQTATFAKEGHAACINALYQGMRTAKWYPTESELARCMAAAGWTVISSAPAPVLTLTSEDLARRYALTEQDVQRVRADLVARFGEIDQVFELRPNGFCAYLHYRIITCVA